MKQASRGFTIVEVLIVIVVIAILAAVTIVAFNGVQKRAQTSQYIALADSIEKQIRSAMIEDEGVFGTIAAPGATYRTFKICYGTTADYPATTDFGEGECFAYFDDDVKQDDDTIVRVNADLMNLMDDTGIQLPSVQSLPTVTTQGSSLGLYGIKSRGIVVHYTRFSDSEPMFWLSWMSPDNSTCGRGMSWVNEAKSLMVESDRPLFEQRLAILHGVADGTRPLAEYRTAGFDPAHVTLTDAELNEMVPLIKAQSLFFKNMEQSCSRNITGALAR